ncbi:MAG: 4Fe-4S binding protein [Elusimicrobia bacterium]|nr:4Fe-4S binding protein [Elusimicrobiota bacterium]
MPRLAEDPMFTPATLRADRPQRENLTGDWRSLRPGIDASRCTGCLLCWKFCPEACVDASSRVPVIDFAYCKGCGICAAECPPKCIELAREAEEDACAKS